MNRLLKILPAAIALIVIVPVSYAAEITESYSNATVLTADTLDTIKAAVNDNNTRIDSIATTPGPAGAKGATGAAGTNAAGPYSFAQVLSVACYGINKRV